jgi:hypothetical protein
MGPCPRKADIQMKALALVLLLSVPAAAQDSEQLLACQAQVQKLAQDVVTARLEALRKTEEAKAYDAAVKQQQALKPKAPEQAKQ